MGFLLAMAAGGLLLLPLLPELPSPWWPLAAALFTNMLASTGATSGVGDIHGALYSAYAAQDGVFRDVTTGTNGDQADVDRHADAHNAALLPVRARTGYDTVTGLGAPLWPLLTPYLFSPKAPQAHAAIELYADRDRRYGGAVPNRVR